MNTVIKKSVADTLINTFTFAQLEPSLATACQRIAPTWPLDQFIAVNPYWGFVDQPVAAAARQLGEMSGTPLVMPRAFYRAELQAGRLTQAHLQGAIDASRADCDVAALLAGLNAEPAVQPAQTLITTLLDGERDLSHAVAWVDFVTHQVSQHCAAYFDVSQAAWNPERTGLYSSWAAQAANDHSAALLMGYTGFGQRAAALPRGARELIVAATLALGLQPAQCADYYSALLMSINGWSSWCAYERWQACLGAVPGQVDDDKIMELLAIRLAWEWLLYQNKTSPQFAPKWIAECHRFDCRTALLDNSIKYGWLYQTALELAYQQPLCQDLMRAPARALSKPVVLPAVQAIFCIDVRSEVFRRALEASSSAIQTRGFAGFFGLFISYSPTGTNMTRPQLPGLLASSRCVTDECDSPSLGQVIARRRMQGLQWRKTWQEFRSTASSGFTFVESCGFLYAGKLLKNTLGNHSTPLTVEQTGLSNADVQSMRPRLQDLAGGNAQAELESRCTMAAGILGAIGLRQDFARIVLLAGHGSQTANNPHAAGLDCGACGGQTGEVNARALAALLNDAEVRSGLVAKGISVPAGTWFLGGLHNTTTDELTLYDTDLLPASHVADLQQLKASLLQAGQRARAERAPALGLAHLAKDAAQLESSIMTRANDWAQVRPEWGLANNAAFIVAPRARSQHLDLAGRAFLHDYDYAQDATLGVLELIMTAPMVVTNWINMQYYASVVDNPRYGSGNKVLHNVVGGRLGVFEGNGGDLRIGLPMQSLHDGSNWRHTPLRLSVFIEAPRAAIDSIMAKHLVVRQLVNNQWLHLFQIETVGPQSIVSRYIDSAWQPVS
jgi:uncharacterized protein YbcC (UPF0753/DUF2309 family)